MKSFSLSFLILACFCISNNANCQCPDSILLSRQSQVDSFFILYPNCFAIPKIKITGDSITNLDGMLGIKSVDTLMIDNNPLLKTLHGLDSLNKCDWLIRINNNDALENLIGLESLTGHVWTTVHIVDNLRIKDLKGLRNLKDVFLIIITYNDSIVSLDGLQKLSPESIISASVLPQLKSLMGLENLTICRGLTIWSTGITDLNELSNLQHCGNLNISYNKSMTSLYGLQNLLTAGDIEIKGNSALSSLDGFKSLASCQSMWIEENAGLVNLHGLENLKLISGLGPVYFYFLKIKKNNSLLSLEGLDHLEKVNSISILYNPLLSNCAIPYICNALTTDDPHLLVWDNAPGCDSIPEILNACGIEYNYVRGSLFIDLNCNFIHDSTEAGLPHQTLFSPIGSLPLTMTGPFGNYSTYFLQDTLTIRPKAKKFFTFYPPEYTVISDTSLLLFDQLDFGFCPDTSFHDLAVTLSSYTSSQPGFNQIIQVCAQNFGTYIEDGILTLDFTNLPGSEYATIVSAEGNPVISGLMLTWHVNQIPIFGSVCFNVIVHLSPDAPIGTTFWFQLSIAPNDPVTEVNTTNNYEIIRDILVGSYDPNSKTSYVNRDQIEDNKTSIEYMIRFQNTGTYSATFVEISDTIEPGLDIRSFEMIAASHPYTVSFPDTNIIKWRFEEINLPDSSRNEIGSHGFVRFRIDARHRHNSHSVINNKASIYFDYNKPIVTNTTSLILNFETSTTKLTSGSKGLSIFPNPTNGKFQISIDGDTSVPITIEILDTTGKLVKRTDEHNLIAGQQIIDMDLHGYNPGLYFIRVLSKENFYTGKVFFVSQ